MSNPRRPSSTSIKQLSSTAALKVLMTEYYHELADAARDHTARVAWCSSVGPAELLRALGFRVYFPENHGAMLGASRMAQQAINVANAAGYSPDICSYLTSDVGACLRDESPLCRAYQIDGPPRPDVLVYNTNQCRDIVDWFAFYQRRFGVPLYGVETPRAVGDLSPVVIAAMAEQHRRLGAELAQLTGQELSLERLRSVTASSFRTSRLWSQVLATAAHRPSPLTFFDATIQMAPAVVLRGDPRAELYYEALLAELDQRIARGVSAVDGETYRVYWEGMPIWGKLREHAELFAELKTAVVASTYCNSWIFEALGDDDPYVGMARAYTELFIVRTEQYKELYIDQMAAQYGVDALIFHDAKTCPQNSNSRYGMPLRLLEQRGLPHLVIHGDLNDLRLYSDEQTRTQVEALVEQLEQTSRCQ